ncbi:uncharacterized protein E0L32_008213 [Thyridium curvatum]|uniref:Heavy metal tolerance protein n=1 Tax=Thyridium curvatum TaxID=1093900 RepID=A0A507AWM5_9PEZI|nr:uncharacterized protein E0L32_008213 [Thyridium curvatum]TPX10824.1 hypothetical protein E0L32_008213 [Thyridium curvatum]
MMVSPARTPAEAVQHVAELAYVPVLLFVFITLSGLYSIFTSESEDEAVPATATGPGGRPLPMNKKRKKRSRAASNRREADEATTTSTPTPRPCMAQIFQSLMAFMTCTFLADGVTIGLHVIASGENNWWCGEEHAVYIVAGAFLYLYIMINLLESRHTTPTIVYLVLWVLGFVGETTIFVSNICRVTGEHFVLTNVRESKYTKVKGPDTWDLAGVGIASVRLFTITVVMVLYFIFYLRRSIDQLREKFHVDEESTSATPSETTPLLNGNGNGHGRTYTARGSVGRDDRRSLGQADLNSTNGGAADPEQATAFYRPEKLPHKTWWEYVRGYSLFFPYLWPRDSRKLRFIVLICFILLVLQRIVNFLVPNQIGVVADALTENEGQMPWAQLCILIALKILQGQSGLLGSFRSLLWIPVSQYSYRALTTAAFEHVHSLSLEFHLGKRTGEVLSALNKGASINSFLEQVTFQVFPMLIDLIVAILYFLGKFGISYATIASIVTWYYLHMTIRMASTRADQRRDMVNADREEEAVKNDSITSYETVKYFNAEDYEFKRYRDAIHNFQVAEKKVTVGMQLMNICQNLVFMCGILSMLLLGAYQVAKGFRTVGDFMILISYLGQLQGPLNYFGTFYRTVQQAMISGERLLELFKIQPTVVDRPGVPALETCRGHIRWKKVRFYYDKKKPALHDLDFECKPGTTTAFVGESGGGKSTVFRLMFRYYNCHQGAIEIDGRDVKDVTIDSVRRYIGVVPQDTILFNESIMYNLRYANQKATDEMVYDACKAASIHDRIMSFAEGYNTKVGDRGIRLSGGEKQRVAIARTILKNPRIIMLDEATSALDSETEHRVQASLIKNREIGSDRTLLVIAHRLSTITQADQIIVLHAGAIVEKGTHQELLDLGGRYSSMWDKQSKAEEAANQARSATRRATRLLRQAHIAEPQAGEDSSDDYSVSSSALLHTGPTTPGAGSVARSEDSSSSSSSSEDEATHSKTVTRSTTAE